MKKESTIKGFAAGCICALMIVSLITPAGAAMAGKMIEAYTGVNIYIDDVKFNPTDAYGNAVEPLVYNGTTYLPVRAISTAFGKNIQWDGKTSSVYIGKHESSTPAIMLSDLDYFKCKGDDFEHYASMKDNAGNQHVNVLATEYTQYDNVYKLNAKYTKLTGVFFQDFDHRSSSLGESVLQIYSDGKLIYTTTEDSGFEPVNLNIDLTGTLELEIKITTGLYNCVALGECALYS